MFDLDIPSFRGKRVTKKICDYVVIDIETTGFTYKDDSIIEVSALRIRNNEKAKEISFLLKPKKQIPDYISDLTGITNDMLENAPDFKDIAEQILSFIGDDVIIGHNIIFDIDRLNYNLIENECGTIGNNYIDTMYIAKNCICDIENYKIQTIAKKFKIAVKTAHRALADCFTTFECYKVMCDMGFCDCENQYIGYFPPAAISEKEDKGLLDHEDDLYDDIKELPDNHLMHGKTIVITGELSHMSRSEAEKYLTSIGCICSRSVTKRTDFLLTNSSARTAKMKKALEYKKSGQNIEIINEEKFWSLIH